MKRPAAATSFSCVDPHSLGDSVTVHTRGELYGVATRSPDSISFYNRLQITAGVSLGIGNIFLNTSTRLLVSNQTFQDGVLQVHFEEAPEVLFSTPLPRTTVCGRRLSQYPIFTAPECLNTSTEYARLLSSQMALADAIQGQQVSSGWH